MSVFKNVTGFYNPSPLPLFHKGRGETRELGIAFVAQSSEAESLRLSRTKPAKGASPNPIGLVSSMFAIEPLKASLKRLIVCGGALCWRNGSSGLSRPIVRD
jgi:hypothetical protein